MSEQNVVERSVGEESCGVVKKCWGRVLQGSVGDECCREVLKRSVRDEHCIEVKRVVEKCWGRVLQRRSIGDEFSR